MSSFAPIASSSGTRRVSTAREVGGISVVGGTKAVVGQKVLGVMQLRANGSIFPYISLETTSRATITG